MPSYELSAILLFQDDEDIVGTAIARLADTLRCQSLSFEILAVDVDSRDNSTALLALLRKQYPELRIAPGRLRSPHLQATRIARGGIVCFLTPAAALSQLESLAAAFQRVASGARDLIVVRDDFALARRAHLLAPLGELRSHGRNLPPALVNQVRRHGFTVETQAGTIHDTSGRANDRAHWLSPLLSLLALKPIP